MVFTATISNAFSSIFDKTAQGVAVQISPKNPRGARHASGTQGGAGVPVSVVKQLRANRDKLGCDRLASNYTGAVALATAEGKALQTGNAPSIGSTFLPPDKAVAKGENVILPGAVGPSARARWR